MPEASSARRRRQAGIAVDVVAVAEVEDDGVVLLAVFGDLGEDLVDAVGDDGLPDPGHAEGVEGGGDFGLGLLVVVGLADEFAVADEIGRQGPDEWRA